MSDTGQDITVPDTMTLRDAIALESDTQGRFTFTLDESGKFAMCTWVNYVKPRTKDLDNAFRLHPREYKKVVIS